ncbi:MAG: threonine--tRNA ligase [Candidatus Babeliaceae bacterium]|jgi:threonyl-tRNA synthetase
MKDSLSSLRHSAAHLVGHAVSELFPGTLLTIGPATSDGFFYDCLPTTNFKEEDLVTITERMNQLVKQDLPLLHKQISKQEAYELFKHNPFKLELLDQIPGETVGLASQGDFHDLCRGGHVASTGLLKYFKLTGISGSYWRADKSKQALQRISGIVFFTEQELEDFEKKQEELLEYDHRKLGKQLDYFSFHEEGVGFPFFHPKGKRVINILTQYMRTLREEYNYQEIETPTMLSDSLWRRSGHYSFYKENMYFSEIDETNYAIKPMNCPGSILVYKNRPRSYRELPLKLAEFGHVHRHELSGTLHGLMRVRAFTQDDVHIYCTLDQIEEQITTILHIALQVFSRVGFSKISLALSTKPSKALGDEEQWAVATNALKQALENSGKTYKIQQGEGAFYGPKIDMSIEDAMGRLWQCGTIQVDFFQAENFDLSYVSTEGTKERPVIIHSTIYGSLERFFAIVLEHHKGALPVWLAPLQVTILTITDAQKPYAEKVLAQLKEHKIRAEIDQSSDHISIKIRSAQREKTPLMLVIGEKEVAQSTVTVRYLDGKQEMGISCDDFMTKNHLKVV